MMRININRPNKLGMGKKGVKTWNVLFRMNLELGMNMQIPKTRFFLIQPSFANHLFKRSTLI